MIAIIVMILMRRIKTMQISELITAIHLLCEDYLSYVRDFNECAYTDSIVEKIIERASELKIRYDEEV